MSLKSFIALLALVCGALGGSIYFSKQGFQDFSKLKNLIADTEATVGRIEKENQMLRQRLTLLQTRRRDMAERELREILGWVKAEELVYLESTRK